jgi:transcriptional regulator with XRE-family HTH domain
MKVVVESSILWFYVNYLVKWVVQGEKPLMDRKQAKKFGAMVRDRREELGISTTELARLVGTRDSTISRIELGAFATPRPDKLAGLAEHLQLSMADVFAAVGYVVPTDLPSCEPYLRSKYPELPEAAIAEIVQSFERVTARYESTPLRSISGDIRPVPETASKGVRAIKRLGEDPI